MPSAANAPGNTVSRPVRKKISQTWLASQTGPIAWPIAVRRRRPARPPGASRCSTPGAEVGAAEDGVGGQPGPDDREQDVGERHAAAASGRGGASAAGAPVASRRSSQTVIAARTM